MAGCVLSAGSSFAWLPPESLWGSAFVCCECAAIVSGSQEIRRVPKFLRQVRLALLEEIVYVLEDAQSLGCMGGTQRVGMG